MIRVEELEKSFGRSCVLRGVSFDVARGELVGFVGPNGAGKTTTLRIASGFMAPDSGRVTINGHDVVDSRRDARASVGYLPESVPLYPEMRVTEYLAFRARLKGVPRRTIAGRIAQVCAATSLTDRARQVIGELSRGYRQRVGIADALIANPPVLLLDEPTSGLDPMQVRELRELLRGLAGDHTVLISSHALSEIGALASRVVMLAAGRVVGNGTTTELQSAAGLPADAPLEDVFVALTGAAD